MITLDFNGPYSLSQFKLLNNINVPGVYIWGFNRLLPKKPDTVIPYYVGIKIDSILSRINRHIEDIKSDNSTYMRLSEKYMSLYFHTTSPAFPLLRGNESKTKPLVWEGWNIDDFNDNIEYYNNSDFLDNIKKCSKPLKKYNKNDYPISNMPDLNDSLLTRINSGNFWIFFAPINLTDKEYIDFRSYINITKKNKDRAAFEIIEAYVKFSLLGNTVGHSSPFSCWTGFPQIKLNCKTNLFKNIPSTVFNGNY